MSLASTTSLTIGGLLFPGADSTGEIQQRLHDRRSLEPSIDAIEHVPRILVDTASVEVGSVVAGLLDTDLIDVLILGWRKLGALAAAAQATLWTPGEEQIVELATHEITSTHEPRVELFVDGVSVGSIGIEIGLSAIVHALRAVVFNGRLTAIRSGRIELSATFSCEGVEISSMRREIDPSLGFDLGSGIPLVEPPAYVRI